MRAENTTKNVCAMVALALVVVAPALPAESARILAIEPFAAKSHWNFMSAVLRALTDGGHHVTVFTPFPDGNRENYTEVDTSGTLPIIVGKDLMLVKKTYGDVRSVISLMVRWSKLNCDGMYKDRRLADVLAGRLRRDFDAIVIQSGVTSCLTYATAGTDLPVIHVVPYGSSLFEDRRTVGDVPNPAAVSPTLADHAVPKTFAQRFSNTLISVYAELYVALHDTAMSVVDPKPYDAYVPVPPSIVFTNSHYISDASRPIPANTVNVGGIHLKPARKIPKDILEFIETSSSGVILLTFGSIVSMSSMPDRIKTDILEALAQLPQRTLMKYEGEMEDKPDNIMIGKWIPQRDILAHPNVKLFISHGGISGVYEAVDAGVPVLGFPLAADQYRNIDNLVEAGMAISMDILSVTKDAFFKNVVELVENEKYKKNAAIVSNIFKDRPMSPQQSVVYWTEYAIRHKGAPHLKSQALNLTWYQYFLLDVIAVMSILIIVAFLVAYKVHAIIYSLVSKYLRKIKTKPE